MTDTLATWGGWGPAIRDDPFGHFAEARARCPVQKVRLAAAFEALLGRHSGLRLAAARDALAWAAGDGLVLRGLLSLPVVPGPARRRDDQPPIRSHSDQGGDTGDHH